MRDDAKNINETYADLRMSQILNALEALTAEKPYPSITVKTICNRAKISRPTFYRYFKDKDDVVQWYWNQSGERYLGRLKEAHGWYEENLLMLREFKRHSNLMIAALAHDQGMNSCIKHGCRQRVYFLQEAIAKESALELTDDIDFEIKFFADAESRAIAKWVIEGMREKPEVIARRIKGCVPVGLRQIVDDINAKKSTLGHEEKPRHQNNSPS